MVSQPKLVDYRIRESRRAKHVSIQISLLGEVEVVVPVGFDQHQVPRLIQERRAWIHQTVQQLKAERQAIAPSAEDVLPTEVQLRSRQDTSWHIDYIRTNATAITAKLASTGDRLQLSGAVQAHEACRECLRTWLKRYAAHQLIPWLHEVSAEIDLPFQRASIRGQRTRWASCSNHQSISLNYKLLFLPPELVRYVFIHELCHTQQMNHSAAFWTLVEANEPAYRALDTDLRKAWRYVPAWAER